MAIATSLQTLYANEMTMQYEQMQSMMRGLVTTKGNVRGDKYIFIVETKASEAKERGSNGVIPVADDSQFEVSCSLKNYHHKSRRITFDIVSSSVDQRGSMQRQGVKSINQKTDQLIFAKMMTTTYTTGAAQPMTLSLALQACERLWSNEVEADGDMYGVVTPRAWAQLMKQEEFTSQDWVGSDLPFMKGIKFKDWMGVKWRMHTRLPGTGTASASCFVWHKSAIGHAMNMGEYMGKVGENEEDDYYWTRTSSIQGSEKILNDGIVRVVHDDTIAP